MLDGEPTIVKLANSWIIINVGGGPTDDKPGVTLEPPRDRGSASAFLNIRVADIQAVYRDWSAKGADFLTPPKDRGVELRCYLRDPDGHLIELGQLTGVPPSGQPAHSPLAIAEVPAATRLHACRVRDLELAPNLGIASLPCGIAAERWWSSHWAVVDRPGRQGVVPAGSTARC